MFPKVGFENIIKSKIAVGLEIVILQSGAYEMNVVVFKKTKATLTLEKKAEGLKEFSELLTFIDPATPVVLLLNGKGIIHRKVTTAAEDTASALLNKVLPNANIDEFIVQRSGVGDNQAFVSVIRKSSMDELLNALKTVNLTTLVNCFLGPFVLNNVLSLMDDRTIVNNQLRLANYLVHINEHRITDVKLADRADANTRIFVANEHINTNLVLAYAAGVSYFVDDTQSVLNAEHLNTYKEDFKQKKMFEFFGWTLLITAFSVLMINYFIFSYYGTKSQEANALFSLNQSALEHYQSLKAEYDQKKEFLDQNDLLESSRTSLYVSELAKSLPENMQWLDVNICPLKKKQNADNEEEFYFENKTITISGKCRRSADLNDWIKKVKQHTWVKSTALQDYRQDDANEDGVFLIKIELNN